MKPTVAAFDFDGTLTYHDSLIPFLCFMFGHPKTYAKLLGLLPYLAAFPLGLISRKDAKEAILTAFLKDSALRFLETQAALFAKEPLMKLVKPQAWQKYQWHLSQGHTCVLISANLSLYLTPFGKQAGFTHILATELATSADQLLTGKLLGENCWGEEKVRRLDALFGPKKEYLLYAYGDSKGDEPLLKLADFPFYRHF